MKNIRERDPDIGAVIVHLPNDYGLTTFHTLCGLCDVPLRVEDTDDTVDCKACLGVMKHVLKLAADRRVLARVPSARVMARAKTNGRAMVKDQVRAWFEDHPDTSAHVNDVAAAFEKEPNSLRSTLHRLKTQGVLFQPRPGHYQLVTKAMTRDSLSHG